jgi:hypothetical protein
VRARLALLVATVATAACGSAAPPVGTEDPIAVVEAYVEARNDIDWETHRSFLAGEARRHPFGSRDEFESAVVLERDIHLIDCRVQLESARTGSFVACTVEVTDIISDVSGRVITNANASTFSVLDGFIVDLPDFLPSDFIAESAIEAWAEASEAAAYRRACPEGIAGQSAITGRRCAEFIAAHVDDWSAAVIEATS